MARFSDVFLDELRSRTSLEEIVSEYVPLKQKGRRFWGCCPFHNEKTPSFSVDSESQLYYCFGCHKGGTALNFVMEMERMEFQEAVKFLAERAHLEIPEPAVSKRDGQSFTNAQERERIYEANVLAARYFHSLLWTDEGAEVLNYLYKRGLNDSDIRRFGLGASPRGWDTLTEYLGEKGFEPQLLKKAGLAVERDGRFYDMFRGRAIFPIINAQGKVLGFGGRAMGDAQPKYLNTPDTPVFNKRQGLYALNFAKNERDAGRLVLVEGYMDTVSLRKSGVRGVVATLGTALTQEQAKLIKRYAPEVLISYDGDSAGQKAALRALDIFDEIDGLKPRVVDYPAGQDPDDFIRAHGIDGFERLPKYDAAEYRMLRARDDLDISTQDGMTQYALRCCEILKKVKNPVEMENHLRRLANQTGYDREILLRQIGVAAISTQRPRELRPRMGEKTRPDDAVLAERVLLTLLAEAAIPMEMIHIGDFSSDVHRRAAEWLLEGRSAASFVENIEDEKERSTAMQALNYSPLPADREDRMKLAESSMRTIRHHRLRERMSAIEQEIHSADSAKKAELYAQMQKIMQALED
ncbi:MAG: DNA primase [Clostridia bacterium]|nr:DNA primase [Clostridia bacterium]